MPAGKRDLVIISVWGHGWAQQPRVKGRYAPASVRAPEWGMGDKAAEWRKI